MAQFAIVMREDDDAWARLAKEEQDRLLALYYAWIGELRSSGAFVTGNPIGGPGRVLRRTDGDIVESATNETKQVLTGYFIVEAADLAAATGLARGCPALVHGETLEIRPVGHG